MTYRIGFDIGGTFTDVFVVDERSGNVTQEKVPTTPSDFAVGALSGIEKATTAAGIDSASVTHLSHGSTVATNAIVERNGATTGLITTEGFRDLVAFGRENRESIYNISARQPPTFVERKYRRGVTERISATGDILTPLDEGETAAIVDELAAEDVDSIAVAFLHAYRNNTHEQRVAEIIENRTELPVSVSSEVMPEIFEYERTTTTLIDAYVSAAVREYIDDLETGVAEMGIDVPLHVMLASGGVITPEHIEGRSLKMIGSGPAAGVIGAKTLASRTGIENLVTLDMGGTSADACLIQGGDITTTKQGAIELPMQDEQTQLPLMFEQIDVRSVGTGGGSIAWVDRAGVLKVGPKSAGARPGPACYGRGGTKPTVTDAALTLGYLDPATFLGGAMTLDESAASTAIDGLASELGRSPLDVAEGVLTIATNEMTQAIRLVTIEKGYDPRDFALCCYGGAGPMFGWRLARAMGMDRTFVPVTPGVLSAYGLVTSDRQFDFSVSRPLPIDATATDDIKDVFAELRGRAATVIGDPVIDRRVDVRYHDQTFTLTVDVPDGPIDAEAMAELRSRFNSKFKAAYGHSEPDRPVEAVTWRLRATTEIRPPEVRTPSVDSTLEDAVRTERDVYHNGEFRLYTIYDRYKLPPGISFNGPAIIEEDESTTIVDGDAQIRVDDFGNLHVTQ